MNKTLVKFKLVDNTKVGSLTDDVFVRGYTEYKQAVIPNEGIDIANADRIHFYHYGMYKVDEDYVINKKDIFLRNGYLQIKGIICERKTIEPSELGFKLASQEFFRVVDSNMSKYKENDLIMCVERTSYKFNYNSRRLVFINPDNVVLKITQDGLKTGDNYMLLDFLVNELGFIIEDKNVQVGRDDEDVYYFSSISYLIMIDGKSRMIVNKKDIKLKEVE
jgi:hypothetical protein